MKNYRENPEFIYFINFLIHNNIKKVAVMTMILKIYVS